MNDAVGDMERIVGCNKVGAVLTDFSPATYARALEELELLWDDAGLGERCRRVAEEHFGLKIGLERYAAMYARLACPA